MKTVGIRELKNALSEYLRQVRAGERVVVTDRGEAVAELRQPAPHGAEADRHPGLEALARRGSLTIAAASSPAVYPALPPLLPEGGAALLLTAEREERGGR